MGSGGLGAAPVPVPVPVPDQQLPGGAATHALPGSASGRPNRGGRKERGARSEDPVQDDLCGLRGRRGL